MKRIMLAAVVLTVFSNSILHAFSNGTGNDNTKFGYVAVKTHSDAKFFDDKRSFSSYSGAGVSLMFHSWSHWWENQKDNVTNLINYGIDYSYFGGKVHDKASSTKGNFTLNNLIVNARVNLFTIEYPMFYFEGGYGLSVLSANDRSSGGCSKWGFGASVNLARNLYINVETNRWDGPGPVGFWSPSLGMEYHF